jgi:hypothetical protein
LARLKVSLEEAGVSTVATVLFGAPSFFDEPPQATIMLARAKSKKTFFIVY